MKNLVEFDDDGNCTCNKCNGTRVDPHAIYQTTWQVLDAYIEYNICTKEDNPNEYDRQFEDRFDKFEADCIEWFKTVTVSEEDGIACIKCKGTGKVDWVTRCMG
jgi:hypothetical protein